ncbi:MAG TPA: GGDEF domain-containing protein, partial [Thermoanaerobaculia bacterium]
GGEEFAVILPETQLSDAIQFAEKIRNAIAESIIPTSESLHAMTVSIGVASVPYSELNSPDELVRAADQALYRAKTNGRNRVEAERRKVQRDANRDVRPAITRLRSDRRSLQP